MRNRKQKKKQGTQKKSHRSISIFIRGGFIFIYICIVYIFRFFLLFFYIEIPLDRDAALRCDRSNFRCTIGTICGRRFAHIGSKRIHKLGEDEHDQRRRRRRRRSRRRRPTEPSPLSLSEIEANLNGDRVRRNEYTFHIESTK